MEGEGGGDGCCAGRGCLFIDESRRHVVFLFVALWSGGQRRASRDGDQHGVANAVWPGRAGVEASVGRGND